MSNKSKILLFICIISAVFVVFNSVQFLKTPEKTISNNINKALQNEDSDYRTQLIYKNKKLSFYQQNEFIPSINYLSATDTIVKNQNSIYYIKNDNKNNVNVLTLLNLTALFNANTESNYTVSIAACTDCKAVGFANNRLYIGKKGNINFTFYTSILVFFIALLALFAINLKGRKKLFLVFLIPLFLSFLWILSSALPTLNNQLQLFNYSVPLLDNYFKILLAFTFLAFVYKIWAPEFKKFIAIIRCVYVALLSLLFVIYLKEIAPYLVNLTELASYFHALSISILLATLCYQAVRLKAKSKVQIISIAALSIVTLITFFLSLLPIAVIAFSMIFNRKRKNLYLTLALLFSIAISVYTEISYESRYDLKQTAFVNSLVDREKILQAYDFPQLIKEAKSTERIYDLSFKEIFATLFQNEYLGYYNYKTTSNDSAIITKEYTPYGLGYFTVFEKNKAPLDPDAYAFYIGDKLVEEQPLGAFQKVKPKNSISGFSQFNLDDYSVLLPQEKIDYIKLFSRATFIFLLLYALTYIYNNKRHKKSIRSNLNIAILTFSLAILALWAGISYQYLTQSERNNIENSILEKTQSLQIELQQKIGEDPNQINNTKFLNTLLRKFSTVFFTDINLYKTNGKLLASSRPQVYQAGLLSERINPTALFHFQTSTKPMVASENIDKINFISAYSQIQLAGESYYIHLPLFNRNQSFEDRLENLTEVFINLLLMVFLLASTLSIFLSYRISQPLLKLSNNIRNLSILGKNERAFIPAEKELKALSLAYNTKVKELEASVQKITENEREKTWRSMARQVAHEIKNPLTPIKLNAQFFERQLENGTVEPEKFKKFLASLQEQVNNLSRVASDFNDLASFNNTQAEKINLTELLQNLPSYQAHQEHIRIEGNATIIADKSHITRIFNNLISNAVEACDGIPDFDIDISIYSNNQYVEIRFFDNGPGISSENQEKIFLPNFSTKKTGMGLGLYMISTLVKQNNGSITLEDTAFGACFKLCFLAAENTVTNDI